MTRRKAKGTTLVDKKLKKAEMQIINLQDRLRAAQMQTLNLRQMYEGVVQEKQSLQNQLGRTSQMLTALLLQHKGNKAVLKEKTLAKLKDFAGVDSKAEDGNLHLFAVTLEEAQAMQDEIETITEEDE